MKNHLFFFLLLKPFFPAFSQVQVWTTRPAAGILLQASEVSAIVPQPGEEPLPTIFIDPTKSYQQMDGFGFTLTGGSAQLINRMGADKRAALLEELFGTKENGIGISYLRISIGASDLSDRVFSYCDLPEGQTDVELEKFSIEPERKDLIPILKAILEINPEIKIMGSPWSPPVWMKTNGKSIGGSLKPGFYGAYARYFVKYIQAMQQEGILIDAITVQNEPLHSGNNPSLLMQPHEQAEFIKKHLGPAFEKNDLLTKILIYDHNADRPDYPIAILNDPEARKYIDGSAFHLYGGTVEAIGEVHEAHPDKRVYFTEQWIGAPGNMAEDLKWHVKNLIIGATRNWCRTVLEWNLAADPQQNPHTEGGCTACLGALTIDGDAVTRNTAYYIVAHASRFVRPDATRIFSNPVLSLPNVAFQNGDGRTVLIVLNEGDEEATFRVKMGKGTFVYTLEGGAVATYHW
ncbi:MAG: glycoside hydrolase family 30 beta sandwich domain-containing protein [Saprospiraceae bacterium]|nr:glycoside hydrolase family 30 beta sandwich domain-containing protein [Saprospiraceae bacterium]MDZ4704622.1 glycoside hydrolase family 30 beta sandwich domain-containing protein [Saprospiraceae bacterium]